MKIAIITLNNPCERTSGGIESAVYNLSQGLSSLGHEVWIICLGKVKNDIIEKKKGINLWVLPDKGTKGLFIRSLVFATYGKKVIHKLENSGIEVFNGQAGHSSILAFYKPKRAKVILTVHSMDGKNIADIKDCIRMRKLGESFMEIIKYLIQRIWRIFYLSKSDYLIFVSRALQEEFKKYYWFLKKPSFLISNGFPKINHSLTTTMKRYDFIYVGRLDKGKCVDLIITASKILKDKGYKFSIAIVGDGPWKKDIEKLIHKYDLSKYIYLIGSLNQNDTMMYLLKSRFLILCSLYEADPLVIREALSLGVPCIVSGIPILKEKIKYGFNGFLFRNESYKNLSIVLEKALNLTTEKYHEMSENAKNSKGPSWIDVAKVYIKVFKFLVCNNKGEYFWKDTHPM